MPKYFKFLMEAIKRKRRIKPHEVVQLSEECSAIVQRKLPPKRMDPGRFTIPCAIGGHQIEKALCDLGTSINLIPLSLFKKLKIGTMNPTNMILQMADRSETYPCGVVENVLIKVNDLIFPIDFVVLDMDAELEDPIILGRPFLATANADIKVAEGELTLSIDDEVATFSMYKTRRQESQAELKREECKVANSKALVDAYAQRELKNIYARGLLGPKCPTFVEMNYHSLRPP